MGLWTGGSRGDNPPVLVPAVPRLGSAVSFTVEGEGFVLWHDLRLGVLGDVRRPLLT